MACGGSGTCMSIGGWGAMSGLGLCKCRKEEPSSKCQWYKPCRYNTECGFFEDQGYCFLKSFEDKGEGTCVCEHHDHSQECIAHAECGGYVETGNGTRMCGPKDGDGRCSPFAGCICKPGYYGGKTCYDCYSDISLSNPDLENGNCKNGFTGEEGRLTTCKEDEVCMTRVNVDPKNDYAGFTRGCTKIHSEMVSKRCPKTIERDELGSGRKECFCDYSKCNGGAMTANPPTKKCVRGADCENSEDCGEGGYCHRQCYINPHPSYPGHCTKNCQCLWGPMFEMLKPMQPKL